MAESEANQIYTGPWVDPATGLPTTGLLQWLSKAIYLQGSSNTKPIGQVLSGVLNGTQSVADVVIDGRGSVATELDTTANNVAEAAAEAASAGGGMSLAASPGVIFKSDSTEPITTASVTVTPTGGTGPYMYAWTKVSGDTADISIDSDSSATTTFTASPAEGVIKAMLARCTVTDSSGSPLTAKIDVSVSIYNISGVFG